MSFFIIILLGIIQGLTEFLPVSSSGHLVLFYNIFGIESDVMLLSILLHIATLFSVIIYYRKEIFTLIKNPFCQTNKKLIVTTIVTSVLVLIFKDFLLNSFDGEYLFIFFIITAMLLLISDYITYKRFMSKNDTNLSNNKNLLSTNYDITNLKITYKQAIIIGITQAFACIPGISRSGSTIAIAKISGVKNDSATYSFLISIPIIIASLIMEIIEGGTIGNINILGVTTAMIVCFIVGLMCIKLMTTFVKNNKLSYFSYYLIILSAFLIINNSILHWF